MSSKCKVNNAKLKEKNTFMAGRIRRSGEAVFWGVISRGLVEGSGICRKGGRYVQGLQLRPRGPGGWWAQRIFQKRL